MNTLIHILNASSLRQNDLEPICGTVKTVFRTDVQLDKAALDFGLAFDNSRGQWNSTALLSQLIAKGADESEKRIVIVDVDLFIPVLTFVFGEAQFSGMAAIVSMHRLGNQFYGMEENKHRLMQRLEKEIVHELGHTFGLYHCHQFECVMRSSTYVEEIDLKQFLPCHECQKLLLTTINFIDHE